MGCEPGSLLKVLDLVLLHFKELRNDSRRGSSSESCEEMVAFFGLHAVVRQLVPEVVDARAGWHGLHQHLERSAHFRRERVCASAQDRSTLFTCRMVFDLCVLFVLWGLFKSSKLQV